jgi:two-component system sensor histidine kinase AlgZ
MDDSQILSAFTELTPEARARAKARAIPPPLFDACHVGVVLRAVLGVEALLVVGTLFAATTWREWLLEAALGSAAALPATALWLLVTCAFKNVMARWPAMVQQGLGVGLGAVAGLAGAALHALVTTGSPVPWLASACGGALVREDPAKAELVLEDLSDLFRHALADQGGFVTLDKEVAVARAYLEIEQVRFGERLEVEWSIDPAAAKAKVPPLLLQPLVENAVKHGVEPSAIGAQVKVSTQRRGSIVVIKVTNTVPAGQGRPGHGIAQDNVRERLRLLHDVQAQFRTALKDGIYQVRMEVPA